MLWIARNALNGVQLVNAIDGCRLKLETLYAGRIVFCKVSVRMLLHRFPRLDHFRCALKEHISKEWFFAEIAQARYRGSARIAGEAWFYPDAWPYI